MTIAEALGGLGLFLLGMIVMTDGLRSLAGNAMRSALMRFTKTPLSGALTGAITTALLQSSSATTVATVGFVSAGLLSFDNALGIIFGANLGTTVTGWLVAILGFKLQLDTAVLPLIFIGASLKLFAGEKYAKVGLAIAGFGLIFVGISTLQAAMAAVQGVITPDRLPGDSWLGRLQLVSLGIVATIITQSSSAGVATTLAALYAGAINFAQAAALVIGMDVGTTVTAMVATLGGSVDARRTGLSHVMYNVITAAIALSLITPYVSLWDAIAPGQLTQNAEIGLVAFHTSFNLVGVTLLLPFSRPFARLITRLLPGQGPTFTDGLSDELLDQPDLALRAAQISIQSEFIALLQHIHHILGHSGGQLAELMALQIALDGTHTYLDHIQLRGTHPSQLERLIAMMHAFDHLQRIHERCEEDEDRAYTVQRTDDLATEYHLLVVSVAAAIAALQISDWAKANQIAAASAQHIHQQVRPYRDQTITQIAQGDIDVVSGTARLEAIRWLRRVSKHMARITAHMQQATLAIGK
ncbi:Na/Pi cotransporter family protein [Halomicronema sp. CCY15110]|uniref:Na/Pi cotransporter family protein n=1 Tax=Halomicronema sp. CCY15110 TaxID=2767773 RepID=UPI00194FAA1D|nr:Na/Pi symporter [Halomicronema sp. CCY15110]